MSPHKLHVQEGPRHVGAADRRGGGPGGLSHSQDCHQYPGWRALSPHSSQWCSNLLYGYINTKCQSHSWIPDEPIPSLNCDYWQFWTPHLPLWRELSVQESYHMLCYGPIKDAPLWGKIIIKISHLLITLSSALNILIYSYKVTLISLTVALNFESPGF